MRISDWSSDVCSSDLRGCDHRALGRRRGSARTLPRRLEGGEALSSRGAATDRLTWGRRRMFFEQIADGEGCQSYFIGCEKSCVAAIIDPAQIGRAHV